MASSLLSLYADESGIHEAAPHCVLAGYLASRRQWELFDHEWQKAFRKLPAPIREFHAKWFFPRGGDYRKYAVPEQECLDLLERLLLTIERHDLHAFGVGVDLTVFKALSWGERAWLTGATLRHGTMEGGAPSRPYHLCFMHLVSEAMNRAKPGKSVDFFFAQQEQFMGLAAKHFATMKLTDERQRRKIGTIAFPPAADVSALQAADLLANCCYSWFVNKDAMPAEREYALGRCRRDLEFNGWNAECFEAWFNGHLSPVDRQRLREMEPARKRAKRTP